MNVSMNYTSLDTYPGNVLLFMVDIVLSMCRRQAYFVPPEKKRYGTTPSMLATTCSKLNLQYNPVYTQQELSSSPVAHSSHYFINPFHILFL
jgi:hypothetical protein